MTISVAATPVRNIVNSSATHAVNVGNVTNHDTVAFMWLDRTGGAVINSLVDSAGGSLAGGEWVARSSSTTLHILYVRHDVPTTTNFTVTLTTNAAQNSQVEGVILRSDAGGTVYPQYDAVATVATGTGVTTATSSSVTATAAGITLGLLSCSNAQSSTPTALSSETISPAGAAGVRLFASYKNHGASGGVTHSATIATSNFAYHLVAFKESGGGASPPSITDVDTDESITATQTNVVITGTDFSTATVGITQGSTTVAQSIDSQNATTIQFDVVFDAGATDLKYGAATLTVTNADAQNDTQAITIDAPSGKHYVDLVSVDGTADNRITAVSDLEIGDQIEWSNVTGTGVDISDVTVNDDGTFTCHEDVVSFDVRVWDHDDSTWGSVATQTIGAGEAVVASDGDRNNRRGFTRGFIFNMGRGRG